ncbi:MAG: hypothetical protein PHF11_04875 [Candidatus Omnitrophica bacterium]|nr:hypothetical protein [Candidatus Omnitrophota bacterium]
MGKKNRRGQSILEYTLILGVVIGIAILVLFGGGANTGMKGAINSTYQKAGNAITNTTAELNVGVFK